MNVAVSNLQADTQYNSQLFMDSIEAIRAIREEYPDRAMKLLNRFYEVVDLPTRRLVVDEAEKLALVLDAQTALFGSISVHEVSDHAGMLGAITKTHMAWMIRSWMGTCLAEVTRDAFVARSNEVRQGGRLVEPGI